MNKNNMTKTFSVVFIITLAVKFLGLLRDVVFANFYGTGNVANAFFAATRIPTQLIDIVLGSAIVSIFVPIFNEVLQKKGKDNANEFASNFINVISIISTGIAILGIIFAPQVVNLLAGGFSGETYNLTVELIKITFPMIIFTAIAFSLVGFLQSYGEFRVPSMISGISNIVIILFLIFGREKFGIHGVAFCMIFAWLLQVLIQLPFAKKYGYKFKFNVNFNDENLKKIFKLALPVILSTAVLPVNSLVATRLASGMEEGSVAAIEYAYKLYLVISGVFTYAIGNIIFPELSRASADEDNDAYVNIIQKALRMLSYLLVPLTIGIMIFRKDIVSTIYQRGEFDLNSTLMTASTLIYYTIGIIGSGFVEIMNKSFYAKQDTKSPLKIGIAVIILNIMLSIILGKFMSYRGLALATSLSSIINATILLLVANKKQKGILNKEIFIVFSKMTISALIMGISVVFVNGILMNILPETLLNNIIRMIVGAIIGVLVYVLLTILFKINELNLFKMKGGLNEKN